MKTNNLGPLGGSECFSLASSSVHICRSSACLGCHSASLLLPPARTKGLGVVSYLCFRQERQNAPAYVCHQSCLAHVTSGPIDMLSISFFSSVRMTRFLAGRCRRQTNAFLSFHRMTARFVSHPERANPDLKIEAAAAPNGPNKTPLRIREFFRGNRV